MDIKDKINTNVPDNFFKEELRCDYLVTANNKKIWAVEIDLLNRLLTVCKKNNIKVFVFAGTLLGAIRHKGFIPWDDDIDVCMERSEFNKLLSIADKEFTYPYFFQTALTDREYFTGYARLRNSLTTGLILKQNNPNYNHGIYIDIFVMDGYMPQKKAFKKQMRMKSLILHVLNSYNQPLRWYHKILNMSICKIIPYKTVVNWYNKNLCVFNDSADKLTILTHTKKWYTKYWCKREDLCNSIEMPFEYIMVPVPANYKDMLSRIYGNYMEFPPVEKRGTWHEGVLFLDPDIPYKDYFKIVKK